MSKEIIAIGDIHGSKRLLHDVLEKVKDKDKESVYFLGDYVDRGKDSKYVLETLMDSGYKCLMGNHDKMLLDFVYKGDILSIYNDSTLATIKSYYPEFRHLVYDGVSEIYGIDLMGDNPLRRYNEIIREKLKRERTIMWLGTLPYYQEFDEYILVHAGLDLSTENPLMDTSHDDMIWLRPNYLQMNNTGKKLIVGHTIVDEIRETANGMIMCDCGNSFRGTSYIYSTKDGVI